jgi:hypothetical protein
MNLETNQGQGFFSFSPTGQSLSMAASSGQGWMADGDVDGWVTGLRARAIL